MAQNDYRQDKKWLEVLQTPVYYSISEKQNAMNYVRQNFMTIIRQNDVFGLSEDMFIELLESDSLNVESEIKVFECVKKWIDFNLSNLEVYLPKLIRVVRLYLLPNEYLIDIVLPYIWNIVECKEYFSEALHWKLSTNSKTNSSRTRPRDSSNIIVCLPVKQINNSKEFQTNINTSLESGITRPNIGSNNLSRSKKIMAISSKIVEVYNIDENRWIRLKNLNLYKDRYSAAMLGDRLIISGGLIPNGPTVNMVEEVNLENGQITALPPMNEPRQDHRLITVGKGNSMVLYAIGGTINNSNNGIKTMERYDPVLKKWTYLAPLTFHRRGFGVVLDGDDIYVIGGHGSDGYTHELEVYHIKEDKWEVKPSLKVRRIHNDAVIVGKFIYALGGHSWEHAEKSKMKSVEYYDIEKNTWHSVVDMSAGGAVGATLLDNSPMVVGGWMSDAVEVYDANKKDWRKLASLNVPRDMVNVFPLPSKFDDCQFDW